MILGSCTNHRLPAVTGGKRNVTLLTPKLGFPVAVENIPKIGVCGGDYNHSTNPVIGNIRGSRIMERNARSGLGKKATWE